MGKDATADHVDLERAMTDGREAFLGGPADEPEQPAIVGPAGADAINEDVVNTDKATPAGKTKEKPVATTTKEPADKLSDADFRFKSQEEAEKGYKNIQSEKTRLEQRARDLETELTVLKREREKQTQEASAVEAEKTFLEYCTERHEQALTEIDQLDPEAADYRKKAANIWAKKDADIRRKDMDMRPVVAATVADKGAAGTEPAAGTARTPAGDGAAADSAAQVHQYVEETIAAAGLPSDDPLFWMYAQQAPEKDAAGAPLDLDRQIEWALEKTNNYRASLLEGANKKKTDEANARGRQEQLRTQPMGRVATERGTSPGDGKEDGNLKPVSLDEAVEFALEKRRL